MKNININAFITESPFYLHTLPSKLHAKKQVIQLLAQQLYTDAVFTEKEITETISTVCNNPVDIRRYLIDFKFMERTQDGSRYQFLHENIYCEL